MKKIFTLFAALAMVMSMSAVPYLKGSFNGWGEDNSLATGSTTVTLNANATYEFKVNDGSNWYGNNGEMTSTNCTDWTMSTSDGNCKIKTTIAGVYTFNWNSSLKKLSVVYPTEAVEIDYYITGSANLVGGDGWKANEIKMTNNNGTYTHTFTALAAGNYEMKITQGNWDNTLGFSNLATSYVGVTGNNDNNIVMALADATNLTVTVTGTTVSLSLPEKTNTIYFVNEKGWAKVNAYVWTDNPYKPWPGEAMTKVEGKTYGGKDVYTYTYPANNSKVIFNDGGSNQTGDLTYSEATPYYYGGKWNASIAYDKAKYTVNVTAENGTVTGAGEYEENTEVTLVATANEGYEFVNWTAGETVVSIENPYKFTVTADVALVANFQEVAPAIVEMELTMTNLEVQSYGEATGLWASDDDNGVEVMLFLDAEGNLMEEESSIAVGWNDYAVTGTVTKVYNEELATDVYTAELYTTVGETNYKLIITMYAVPVEVVDVVVENATITVEEKSDGVGGTYELINVSAQWGESTLLIEGIEKNYEGFVLITEKFMVDGEEDWYKWMGQNAVITTVDNVLTVAGEFKNNLTGSVYNVTISGTLPVDEPETITWELNGGEVAAVVPTNEELWKAFKPYYNTFYSENRADQAIADVATFMTQGEKIFTDATSEYKWLGDYLVKIATEQGYTINSEALWRWHADAFFNCNQHTSWPKSADFTEAGKPENWGPAYQAAHEVVLPTEPVAEDYVLPTPVKEGYTFVGWYDNAEGEGEAMTVLPAGWAGTLYAIWKVEGPATALENIAVEGKAVKAIINGQLVIIKNGVQYNAQGAILK